MYIENVALILSLFALVVAGLTAWHTRRYERRDNELQSRIVALEEGRERDRIEEGGRADLVAAHVPTVYDSRPRRALRITNRGRAPAREVDIRIDGTPLVGSRLAPWTHEAVSTLGPSTHVDCLLSDAVLGATAKFRVEIRWVDASGQRSYETELSTH